MARRSVWKGPFFDFRLLEAILADKERKGVETMSRQSTIIPAFVGARLFVHNGHKYFPLNVREEMVGMKVGDLVPTIKTGAPKVKDKSKKKK